MTSQGVAAHGATAWDTAGYKGSDVKVGIIDSGFDGFSSLMGTELPSASKVEAQCYTSNLDLHPSNKLADCGGRITGMDYHGTAVAQAVVDVASEVSLYISNASSVVGSEEAAVRLKNDVDWMIREGVDVINYSQQWPFSEGLGDAVPRYGNSPLDTICTAVTRGTATTCAAAATAGAAVAGGIIWINNAGNDNQRLWHGSFSDTNTR